jgi:hypothetical protein
MSGVLDRMAKRALGNLPGVQPLVVSRHAQLSSGVSEGWIEIDQEVKEGIQVSRPQPQASSERSVPAVPRQPDRMPVDTTPPGKSAAELHPPVPVNGPPVADSSRTLASNTPDAPRQAPEAAREAADSHPAVPVVIRQEVAVQPVAVVRESISGNVLQRNVTPAKKVQVSEKAESTTEVHITIGHVELRAPRTETRPPAAPFRPRVTLDEFLRRDRSARS